MIKAPVDGHMCFQPETDLFKSKTKWIRSSQEKKCKE